MFFGLKVKFITMKNIRYENIREYRRENREKEL